jgi:hypothetical protein
MCLKLRSCEALLERAMCGVYVRRGVLSIWESWPGIGVAEHGTVSFTGCMGMLCSYDIGIVLNGN